MRQVFTGLLLLTVLSVASSGWTLVLAQQAHANTAGAGTTPTSATGNSFAASLASAIFGLSAPSPSPQAAAGMSAGHGGTQNNAAHPTPLAASAPQSVNAATASSQLHPIPLATSTAATSLASGVSAAVTSLPASAVSVASSTAASSAAPTLAPVAGPHAATASVAPAAVPSLTTIEIITPVTTIHQHPTSSVRARIGSNSTGVAFDSGAHLSTPYSPLSFATMSLEAWLCLSVGMVGLLHVH